MYKLGIDDVVKDNGYPVVVIDLKNYENVWIRQVKNEESYM